jgi:hypothetical protein
MQTQPNRPHENKTKQSTIANRSDTVAKVLSTHVSNDLTQVYLQKTDHNRQQHSHMPLSGPALLCPLMPQEDQHLHAHFKSHKLSTNTKPHKQQKKSSTSPNSFARATNTKIIS